MSDVPVKAAVSVAEMARMVGLSRSRFYQLQGTAFPPPSRDTDTGRPCYTAEQQATCLEVRRRNCGIDGRPVLFYARRAGSTDTSASAARKPKPRPRKPISPHVAVLDGVQALGLASATAQQVEGAIRELFPAGTAGAEPGEIIRAVFVHLMRRNSNVGG